MQRELKASSKMSRKKKKTRLKMALIGPSGTNNEEKKENIYFSIISLFCDSCPKISLFDSTRTSELVNLGLNNKGRREGSVHLCPVTNKAVSNKSGQSYFIIPFTTGVFMPCGRDGACRLN